MSAQHALPRQSRWGEIPTIPRRRRIVVAREFVQNNAAHFNFYNWTAAGFVDAAAFVHSNFTGLVVTGISILVVQWMVARARG